MDQQDGISATLVSLRALGVRVALDDFGRGYSALARLSDLGLDALKLDRGFLQGLDPGDVEIPVVRAAIAMAHDLGLEVVAEGVETEAQRRFLVSAGCDLAQGYLFDPPSVRWPAFPAGRGAPA